MIRYQVRSRYLVDLVNEINIGSIVISPYFQRKLVWRLAHKVDFIETILLGFPFPEVFISRGSIDVEKMTSTSHIVDGQQRMTAIRQFIAGDFEVNGKNYKDLTSGEKENFLKYEIAVIDLDLQNEDTRIVEIFKRLNRTFYSLTNVERISTEYASSEFMQVAKLLADELIILSSDDSVERDESFDPNITPQFVSWASKQRVISFRKWLLELPIFTKYEVSRQVHLMYVLNVLSTITLNDFYNRNERVALYLEEFSNNFPQKDEIIATINQSADIFNKLRFGRGSYWLNKANAFSLIIAINHTLRSGKTINLEAFKEGLEKFAAQLPDDYSLAAREAVNNKRERLTRDRYIHSILDISTDAE